VVLPAGGGVFPVSSREWGSDPNMAALLFTLTVVCPDGLHNEILSQKKFLKDLKTIFPNIVIDKQKIPILCVPYGSLQAEHMDAVRDVTEFINS
jgi:hypothetical protein